MSNNDKSKPAVAFLGLGIMGAGMAGNLMKAGFPLTVWNRNPDRAKELAGRGASVAATAAEAVKGKHVVVAMLTDDEASRNVWLGENGALAAVERGALLIDSSTLSVDWVRELAAAAKTRGAEFIDAPVSGSKPQAAAGELNFFTGGSAEAVERATPVLSAMGKNVIHLGPVGSGALVKLINNFLSGTQLAAFAEAMAIIEHSELDVAKTVNVLTNGAPGSPMVKTLAARMMANDFAPNFFLSLMAKDMRYAIAEADKQKFDLTTAKTALARMQQAIDAGWGQKDLSAVVQLFR
jgi:3-hydroxyisobutyrate dehydrogenase